MLPIQAKQYVANHFREHAMETDLVEIDKLIQYGYVVTYEAEWHLSNGGYLRKFLLNAQQHTRDAGIDRLDEFKAQRFSKAPASGFLQSFYKGSKPYDV